MEITTVQRAQTATRRNVSGYYQYKSEQPTWQRHWRNINAIMPIYLPGDVNGTIIYFDSGDTLLIESTCIYIVEQLLNYLYSSTDVLRKRALQLLGTKDLRRIPLILGHNLCLLPVQVRKGHNRNHGMTGYVVLNKIKNIYTRHSFGATGSLLAVSNLQDYTDKAAVIKFSDQLYLQAIDCKCTVENNLSMAVDMVRRYCGERNIDTRPFFSSSYAPQPLPDQCAVTYEKNL